MAKLPRWAELARDQWAHRGTHRPDFAIEPGPGQESVWDYWDARVADVVVEAGAWSYEEPFDDFVALAGCFGFYPSRFDCWVDEHRVEPQPGGFYAGWITPELVGPFKGGPGSLGW